MSHFRYSRFLWPAVALLALTPAARADIVRYRLVPIDAQGHMALTPIGPGGALGVRTSFRSPTPEPCPQARRATHVVTVVHPCTGRTLLVPLTLPDDTPRIEHRLGSVIYNYGSYTVTLRFLDDGSVEVVYNSGALLRPL
jgi:hypothetical protein